mmetsp:Transcript_5973/g.17013  ORF Transcript_5973/g.17013 Transcript_5973/m.17013 type:complete len:217 (-) Transcript_5973:1463-2113(-)
MRVRLREGRHDGWMCVWMHVCCVYVAPCVAYAQLVSSLIALHRESERYAKLIRMYVCLCLRLWVAFAVVKFSLTFCTVRFMMRYIHVSAVHTHTDTDTNNILLHTCMAGTGQPLCWLLPENDSKRAGEGGRGRNNSLSLALTILRRTVLSAATAGWLLGWEARRLAGWPSTLASVGFLTCLFVCSECICVPCVGWRLGCGCVGRPLTAGWFLDLHC